MQGGTLRERAVLAALWLLVPLALSAQACSAQKIRVLLTGQIDQSVNPLQVWFKAEPLVDYLAVPSRDLRGILGGDKAMSRFIRIYFPRSYQDLSSYEFILLNSPVTSLFSKTQLDWMYRAIVDGSGGLNTASIMSQFPDVYGGWVESVLQEAFPNDAPLVVQKFGGATSKTKAFHIVVNRDFPVPVLTPFIPLGVERFLGEDSRFIILRPGASALAYQVGNFPGYRDVPYIAVWEYGKGRTMTTGDAFGHTFWSSYRGTSSDNIYALDILMNLIFYATHRKVAEDVQAFHMARSYFMEFRTRMAVLLGLKDFVEKFGARTRSVDEMVARLEELNREAGDRYVQQDFEGCEQVMKEAFDLFKETEVATVKLKQRALMWVYLVEWLATTSVLLFSGFLLWSLMVRRQLYRGVGYTRAG